MQKKLYQYKRLWLLVLFMAYVLLGYLYVPKILSEQISQQLSEQLNMQAEMTAVSFNPLTFNVEISDLKITDSNQQTWFDSQLTGINFDPLNLIWGELNFSELNLVQPKITVLIDEAGQVLIPALPEFPVAAASDEAINLSIDQIRLAQARMNIQAGNIKKDFSLNIKSIELDHDKFSLADIDTHFKIKITTENDESIALKGHYNHIQRVFNSEIKLIDWQAFTLNQILPDELAINIQAGRIQATGNIDWLLSKSPQLNFSSIEIQALQSQYPKGRPWQGDVSFEQLQASIHQVAIDTEVQTVAIERIESTQGVWKINWTLNSLVNSDKQNSSDAVDSVAAPEAEENPEWQIKIDQISVAQWQVELIDGEVNASLPFTVQSLEALNLNNLNQVFTVQGQLNFEDSGQLNINSEQVLTPLAITADINLNQLALQQIAPWITNLSDLVFTAGKLTTEQQLKLNDGYFELAGNLTITNANINDQYAQSMASWGELHIAATTLSSQDKITMIDQITIDQAQGTVSLESGNNINVQSQESNETLQKFEQNSDSNDWTIKIGAIKNIDKHNETATPDD